MLEVLSRVEAALPSLLPKRDQWNSVFVDYHPPFVKRLWTPFEGGDYRIYLHCILPCERGTALFHPHPWPSAMVVLQGTYEMAIGHGKGDTPPPVAATLMLGPNSRYEMTDPDSWHYVRPIGEQVLSLMVTGKPWGRAAPMSATPLHPLSDSSRRSLFASFDNIYC